MTVPPDAFISKQGFFAASGVLPMVTPCSTHPLLDNHFKFLPFCIETHAAAYAAASIAEIQGSSRYDSVEVYMSPSARPLVDRPRPANMHEARFSVQYIVAQALETRGLSVQPPVFIPAEIDADIKLIDSADVGHLAASVVTLSCGRRQNSATCDLGRSGSLDAATLERKFAEIVAPLSPDNPLNICAAIVELPNSRDVSALMRDLVLRVTRQGVPPALPR